MSSESLKLCNPSVSSAVMMPSFAFPAPPPPAQPIVPQQPWEVISIDLLGPFPKTARGNFYICTLFDVFTKWNLAFPIREKSTEAAVQILMQVVYMYGSPKQFWNNQGRYFTKTLNEKIRQKLTIQQKIVFDDRQKVNNRDDTSTKRQKSNLIQYVNNNPDDWDLCLQSITYPYNISFENNGDVTPYYCMYGRTPRDLSTMNIPLLDNSDNVFLVMNYSRSYNQIPEVSTKDEDSEPRPLGQRDTNHRLHQVEEFMKTGRYPTGWGRADKYAIRKFAARFQLVDNTLYYMYPLKAGKKRLVLFTDKDRRVAVNECHIDPVTGVHHGFIRTQKKINDKYYWMEITRDVIEMVKQCPQCTKGNAEVVSTSIHPLQARETWEYVAVDLLGPLPHTAKGNIYILCLTDIYTKFVLTFPLCMKTIRAIANVLIQTIYTHGPPKRFFCGQGKVIVKQMNDELQQMIGIKQAVEMALRANNQSGNQEKCLNKSLKSALMKFTNDNKDDWDDYLPYLIYKMNTSNEDEVNCRSPFTLMYNRLLRDDMYDFDENINSEQNAIDKISSTSDAHSIIQLDNNLRIEDSHSVQMDWVSHHSNVVVPCVTKDMNEVNHNLPSNNYLEKSEQSIQPDWVSSEFIPETSEANLDHSFISNNPKYIVFHQQDASKINDEKNVSSKLDSRICKKIQDLTSQGVFGVKKIQDVLRSHVKQELFKGCEPPSSNDQTFFPTYPQIRQIINKTKIDLRKEGKNFMQLQAKAAAKELIKAIELSNNDKCLGQLKEHLLHLKTAVSLGHSLEPFLMQYKHIQEEEHDIKFKVKKRKCSTVVSNGTSIELEEATSTMGHHQNQVCQISIANDAAISSSSSTTQLAAIHTQALPSSHLSPPPTLPQAIAPSVTYHPQHSHLQVHHQYTTTVHHMNATQAAGATEIYYIMPENCT